MGLCRFEGIAMNPDKQQNLSRLKPGVNRVVHLFAAPLLWTSIGCMLIVRGTGWIGYGQGWGYIALALAIGTAKSIFILDKTARRGVERIVRMRDGTCLGAVYSWKTWMLVGLMMTSGILIRTFFDPGAGIGTLYVAVGCALILSSRHGWIEWHKWVNKKS